MAVFPSALFWISALSPTAVLYLPVVVLTSVLLPIAVFPTPPLMEGSAATPKPVFPLLSHTSGHCAWPRCESNKQPSMTLSSEKRSQRRRAIEK